LQTKICSKCDQRKDVALFNKAKQCVGGVRPECKECESKLSSLNQKKRRATNPDTFRNSALKQKFGITFSVYELMLEDQGYACAICQNKSPGKKNRYFCVDHCHKTGRIRGLLCYSCNAGLGLLGDNVDGVLAALNYLRGT
jgi:hypothetical protein